MNRSRGPGKNIQFNNAIISADIQDLAFELVDKIGDGRKVLVFMPERFAWSEFAGMEVFCV